MVSQSYQKLKTGLERDESRRHHVSHQTQKSERLLSPSQQKIQKEAIKMTETIRDWHKLISPTIVSY